MTAGSWPNLLKRDDRNSQQKQQEEEKRSSSRRPARRCKCSSKVADEEQIPARSPVALGVVVATSLYCGVKAGIQGYQHLRRRNLRHLVRHVAPVLDELGVQYWADFGTLLGMYREKDIILYDNDADLVVLNPDWDWLLGELRARLPGFRVFFVIPSEDRSIRWIRVMSGVGIMDLYGGFTAPSAPKLSTNSSSSSSSSTEPAAAAAADPQQQQQQQQKESSTGAVSEPAHVSIPQGHGDLCDAPANLIFPLGVMKFRGTPVSVPGDVPGMLRYRYGDTFMIPRYMDKGRDCIEQGKLYARLLGALGKAGLRV